MDSKRREGVVRRMVALNLVALQVRADALIIFRPCELSAYGRSVVKEPNKHIRLSPFHSSHPRCDCGGRRAAVAVRATKRITPAISSAIMSLLFLGFVSSLLSNAGTRTMRMRAGVRM